MSDFNSVSYNDYSPLHCKHLRLSIQSIYAMIDLSEYYVGQVDPLSLLPTDYPVALAGLRV